MRRSAKPRATIWDDPDEASAGRNRRRSSSSERPARELPAPELPAAVGAWLRHELGPIRQLEPVHAGGRARTYRVESAAGAVAYLKHYRNGRGFRQELDAYRRWAVVLEQTPPLKAAAPLLGALLLGALPGRPPTRNDLVGEVGAQLLFLAGRFLAALHALEHDAADPLALPAALERRKAAALDAARELLPAPWRDLAAALIDTQLFADGRRVPCHRDFAPRNWQIAYVPDNPGRLTLGVIDFEHARADHPATDLATLVEADALADPQAAAAFWRGYGVRPTEMTWARMRALRALRALQAIVWGQRHGDLGVSRSGWQGLERLASETRSSP